VRKLGSIALGWWDEAKTRTADGHGDIRADTDVETPAVRPH
jgi:hypothetical protein